MLSNDLGTGFRQNRLRMRWRYNDGDDGHADRTWHLGSAMGDGRGAGGSRREEQQGRAGGSRKGQGGAEGRSKGVREEGGRRSKAIAFYERGLLSAFCYPPRISWLLVRTRPADLGLLRLAARSCFSYMPHAPLEGGLANLISPGQSRMLQHRTGRAGRRCSSSGAGRGQEEKTSFHLGFEISRSST